MALSADACRELIKMIKARKASVGPDTTSAQGEAFDFAFTHGVFFLGKEGMDALIPDLEKRIAILEETK